MTKNAKLCKLFAFHNGTSLETSIRSPERNHKQNLQQNLKVERHPWKFGQFSLAKILFKSSCFLYKILVIT